MPDIRVYLSSFLERQCGSMPFLLKNISTLTVAQIVPHFLGAAFTASAPAVPSWAIRFEGGNNIGGLVLAVLSPTGGFGKFLTVLIALSTPSACAPSMYTFGTSFMTIAPIFRKVPQYVFAIISEAMLVSLEFAGGFYSYRSAA